MVLTCSTVPTAHPIVSLRLLLCCLILIFLLQLRMMLLYFVEVFDKIDLHMLHRVQLSSVFRAVSRMVLHVVLF